MKIRRGPTHLLEHRLAVPFQSASMPLTGGRMCCGNRLRQRTDGLGRNALARQRPNCGRGCQPIANWLIGMNPLETEKIWRCCTTRCAIRASADLTLTALSGIDIALWDIKGKHYGTSVSMLLGGVSAKV